jgi:hypothetical protein
MENMLKYDFMKYRHRLLYNRVAPIYIRYTFIYTNIASIFITLTEINNETHYVAKKIKNKKQNKKNPQNNNKKNKPKLLR